MKGMALSAAEIKALFSGEDRRANRALGQNFFTDGELLEAFVREAELGTEPILEIGPGLGALTEPLLKTGAKVIAVEKDAFLAEKLPALMNSSRLTVVTGDILRQDVPSLTGGRFSVAGNLPYYITTPIVELLLSLLPETALIMVQAEAAERFFALPGDRVYGPVAILSGLYYECRMLAELDPGKYYPPPDVRSAVVLMKKRPDADTLPPPKAFAGFIRKALLARRKTIENNLGKDEATRNALRRADIDPGIRAETLSPERFLRLYTELTAPAGA